MLGNFTAHLANFSKRIETRLATPSELWFFFFFFILLVNFLILFLPWGKQIFKPLLEQWRKLCYEVQETTADSRKGIFNMVEPSTKFRKKSKLLYFFYKLGYLKSLTGMKTQNTWHCALSGFCKPCLQVDGRSQGDPASFLT